jgi:hypothetical protein
MSGLVLQSPRQFEPDGPGSDDQGPAERDKRRVAHYLPDDGPGDAEQQQCEHPHSQPDRIGRTHADQRERPE